LPVLVKQAAEEVASAHGASVILAKNSQPDERVRQTKHECPVGTVTVVMLEALLHLAISRLELLH